MTLKLIIYPPHHTHSTHHTHFTHSLHTGIKNSTRVVGEDYRGGGDYRGWVAKKKEADPSVSLRNNAANFLKASRNNCVVVYVRSAETERKRKF